MIYLPKQIDITEVILKDATFEERKQIIKDIFNDFCVNESKEFLNEFLKPIAEDYEEDEENYLSHIKF